MNDELNVPRDLIRYVETGSKFIIAGHKEPDGDCIGSQLSLRSILLRMGKEVYVCSAGPFTRSELKGYTGFFKASLTEEEKSGARLIIVDCTDTERMGSLEKELKGLPFAIIDHHATGSYPPSCEQFPVYIDAQAPACTFLIYRLITALGMGINEEEATLLLFGLCTDTGFFHYLTEKDSSVLEAAAQMLKHGANLKRVYNLINGGKKLDSRILMGKILSRTESHYDGKLLTSYETLEEFQTFGFEGRDSDNMYKLLQSVENVQVIIIIRQESANNCTVSLRSVDKIDVASVAKSLGGGGHKNAAGLTMKGDISNVRQILLKSFSNIFKK